jgi:hypothetical protein
MEDHHQNQKVEHNFFQNFNQDNMHMNMNLSTYDEEHPTNFVVRLSLWHDTLTWGEISEQFEFEILDKYNCGDLKRVPDALERNLRYKQSLVRFDISKGIVWQNRDGDLVDFIEKIIPLLPENQISKLIAQGVGLELSIGLFVPYGVCHYYPHGLLFALGKLGIALKIDYYSGPGNAGRTLKI